MKTRYEIRDEINALREIKPTVRRFTAFGDDNWAAIDVQIDALDGEWNISDADDDGDMSTKRLAMQFTG